MEAEVIICGILVLLVVEVLDGGIKIWKTFLYSLFTGDIQSLLKWKLRLEYVGYWFC
jgi:hypothetical protein